MTKVVKIPGGEVSVQSRPWWLFWLLPGYTITLYPNVYTSDNNLTPEREINLFYICVHEAVHLKQQAALGKWKFYFRYIFSRSFRYAMELEAYTAEFKQQIADRRSPNIESVAENLASFGYLWCVSKKKAVDDFSAALVNSF